MKDRREMSGFAEMQREAPRREKYEEKAQM
jgi:hypothetical protein